MAAVMGVDSSTQSCKVVVRDAETGERRVDEVTGELVRRAPFQKLGPASYPPEAAGIAGRYIMRWKGKGTPSHGRTRSLTTPESPW